MKKIRLYKSLRATAMMSLFVTALLLGSCKSNDNTVSQLSVDKTNVQVVGTGTPATVKITSGNGNYTVGTSNDKVATAVVNGNSLTITPVGEGVATITLTDGQKKTIAILVTVLPNGEKFAWDTVSQPLSQANGWGYSVLGDSIAVTNLSTKQQYVLSWTGDLTKGDKTGAKIDAYANGAWATTSLSTFTVQFNRNDSCYITFGASGKNGEILFINK